MKRNIVLIALITVLILTILVTRDRRIAFAPAFPNKLLTPHLRINKVIIPVTIVRTQKAIQKGLSGQRSLDADKGMLFIFDRPAIYRFWMPNMHFPLDIIWIAGNTIVGITQNISNDFDPARPRFYTPPVPVRRVLEVNAGFAEKNNLRIGNNILFKYTE